MNSDSSSGDGGNGMKLGDVGKIESTGLDELGRNREGKEGKLLWAWVEEDE